MSLALASQFCQGLQDGVAFDCERHAPTIGCETKWSEMCPGFPSPHPTIPDPQLKLGCGWHCFEQQPIMTDTPRSCESPCHGHEGPLYE